MLWTVPQSGSSQITYFVLTPYLNATTAEAPFVVPAGAAGSATSATTGSDDWSVVQGLANGKKYAFTVSAINSSGTGPASPLSNSAKASVTPQTQTMITSSLDPSPYAESVTFTSSVLVGGGVAPIGTMRFTGIPGGPTEALTEQASGLWTAEASTAALAAGTHTVSARLSGGGQGASSGHLAQVVEPEPTTSTTLSSSAPTGSSHGISVTFVATVTVSGGAPAVGSVRFTGVNGSAVALVDDGVASVNTSSLTNGSHVIRATFTSAAVPLQAPSAAQLTQLVGVPLAPTIGAAVAGNAQATVSFTRPAAAGNPAITGYTVTALDHSTPANGGQTTMGTSSPIVVQGLANGDSYTFTVTATNSTGTGPASAPSNAAVPTAPAATPGASVLTMATGGNAQVVLDWTAPSNNGGSPIIGYNILRGTTSGSETLLTSVGSTLTFTDTGLTNGTTYYYEIQAVNAVGDSVASNELSATPTAPATAPAAPNLTSATGGNAQVVLDWTAPSNNGGSPIIGYNIFRGTTPGSETPLTSVGSILTFTDTGLTNGTTYYYEIQAVNAVADSVASNELSATPTAPATAPGASVLTIATGGNAQVVLDWTAPSNNGGSPIIGYNILRGTTSRSETLLTSVGSILTFTDTGLTNGTTYYYEIQAVNAVGDSVASNELSATPGLVPGAPGFVQAVPPPSNPNSNVGVSGSITVAYFYTTIGSSPILYYTVTATDLTTPANGGQTVSGDPVSGATAYELPVTGLVNGDAYTFSVTATNSTGTSVASAASSPVTPESWITVSPNQYPSPIAISADGTNTWVANEYDNSVVELSAPSGSVVRTIAVGTHPIGISSDGTNVWVANIASDTMTQIDATKGGVVKTTALSSYGCSALDGATQVNGYPEAISSDGTRVWVTCDTAQPVLIEFSATTGAWIQTVDMPYLASTSYWPSAVSSDGTNVWVVNTSSGDLGGSISEFNTATGALEQTITEGGTQPLSIDADGIDVWVGNYGQNTITEYSANGTYVQTITLDSSGDGGMPDAISSLDGYVWVTNVALGTITQILASTGAVVRTINVQGSPYGISSDGSNVWMTNIDGNFVTEIGGGVPIQQGD